MDNDFLLQTLDAVKEDLKKKDIFSAVGRISVLQNEIKKEEKKK